eukprot:GHVH01015719.1.p1 GENE.GHVH01015719.1~~GHVH01015719.1.p1  ORF type:complete len:469 (-),score=67.98 GHVH01015719.1:348-1754(-)
MMLWMFGVLRIWSACSLLAGASVDASNGRDARAKNWAVIINMSSWFINYRHSANVHYFSTLMRKWNIPDERILHFQGHDAECDGRHAQPNSMYIDEPRDSQEQQSNNLVLKTHPVDYRGNDVHVETVVRALAGRRPPGGSPRTKVLDSDEYSNIFVYITGHGGDHFIKLRDWSDLDGENLGELFKYMKSVDRFGKLLWVADSCEIASLQDYFTDDSSNVYAIGSSDIGQSAWSYQYIPGLMNSLTDVWTFVAAKEIDDISDMCDDSLSPSIAEFHATVKTKSRAIYKQDARFSVSNGTVVPADEVPVSWFLSECHDATAVLSLESCAPLFEISPWKVPPTVPNFIESNALRQYRTSISTDYKPVHGRFASVLRLSRTDATYRDILKASAIQRDDLLRFIPDDASCERFPNGFPMVASRYQSPESYLKRNAIDRVADSWQATHKLMTMICKAVLMASSSVIVLMNILSG